MMLKKSVSLFNEFHGVNAQVHTLDTNHYTLIIGSEMRGFSSKSEVVNFLLCGTTHLGMMGAKGEYFTAYNLAMMYLNRRCPNAGLVYSIATGGKTTLWGINGSGWFKVGEYSCLNSLYHAILCGDVSEIRQKVKGQTSFLSTLKRLIGR